MSNEFYKIDGSGQKSSVPAVAPGTEVALVDPVGAYLDHAWSDYLGDTHSPAANTSEFGLLASALRAHRNIARAAGHVGLY